MRFVRRAALAVIVAGAGTALEAQTVTPDSVRALLRATWGAPNATTMSRLLAARRHAQRWVAANPDDPAGHAALALAWYSNGTGGVTFNDSALLHAGRVGTDPSLRADMVGIYRAASIRNERDALYQARWADSAALAARGPTRDDPWLHAPIWYAAEQARAWLVATAYATDRASRDRSCALAREADAYLARTEQLFAVLNLEELLRLPEMRNDFTYRMRRDIHVPRARATLASVTADVCNPAAAAAAAAAGPQAGPGATGTIRQLTQGGANFHPDISDSLVVYFTHGVRIETRTAAWNNPLITRLDLSTGVATVLTTDTAVTRGSPVLWGSYVVWEDVRSRTRNPLGQSGNFQIYRYDAATRRQVPVAPMPRATQGTPRISGSRVIWGGDDSVFARDLAGGLPVNLSAGAACPAWLAGMGISGDRAVWPGRCGTDYDVFLYDFSTRALTRLTSDPLSQNQPDVSGDRVVWVEYQAPDLHVMVRDLATGSTTRITPPGARATWPRISGDWVVYVDRRPSGCTAGNEPCPHVYRFDLASGRETRITGTRQSFVGVQVWGTRIVWLDNNQVFLYEEPGSVNAAFQPALAGLDAAVRSGAIRQPGVADPVRVLLRQASRHMELGDRDAAGRSMAAAVRYVEGRSGASIPAPDAQRIVAALRAAGSPAGGK